MNKLKKLIPTKRKIMQLYFALLFNANLKGFISGNIYQGNTKTMCVPGINCYSCPGAIGACPLGSLQGSYSAGRSTIFYVCGILLLYAMLFGRMICGWLCPFGLIQELLYKIKTPKLQKSPVTRILSYFKYVILVFFVFIVPITYAFRDTPLPTFCKYICPAGTIEGGLGLLANKVNESYFSMLGPLFTWKFILMISIVVGSVFVFRLFCRFICPLGALYGLFNRFSIFGIKIEKEKCTNCNLCVNHCKLDIRHVGDQECVSCGDCVNVCPTNAIKWKGPKFLPFKQTQNKTARLITRTISCALLIVLLLGTIFYYWKDTSSKPNSTITQAEKGNEVGDSCYGFNLNRIYADGLSDETINPADTGKITIINFWGTWCTPCVNELPYFAQIADEYEDEVTVITIHTNMVSDTAPSFIAEYYAQSKLNFACDGEGESYYTLLGGRGTYPYTVVLDANGIITNVHVAALEYEDLKEDVENILSSK